MNNKITELNQENILNNICIVLVHTRFPENIGATCRAMKNMGFSDLRLVHPPLDRDGRALKLCSGSEDILESASKYFTVEEALEDVQFCVGTTARLGGWRKEVKAPREAAQAILENARLNKVAILFGSEDRGLPNEVIKYCQMILNFPTSEAKQALNLAQAVLLVCYDLRQHALSNQAEPVKLANVQNVNSMFDHMAEVLEKSGFMHSGKTDFWILPFKRIFARNGLTEKEVGLLRGLCKHIEDLHERLEKLDENEK